MNTQKLLIVGGIGLAVYLFAMRPARAAAARPMAPASGAPTGPAAQAREAQQWRTFGQDVAGIFNGISSSLRRVGQTRTDTGDEAARLAARYPAPDDAVPINVPGQLDSWAAENSIYGGLVAGSALTGSTLGSPFVLDF